MSGTGTTNANGGLTLVPTGREMSRSWKRARSTTPAPPPWPAPTAATASTSSGAMFGNQAGASFSIIDDAWILDGGGSPDGGTFINAATLAKTGGTTSVIGITLDNTGAINVQSGIISLQGGGSLGGTFGLSGTVSLDGGDFNLENGLVVTGAGTVGLTNATATVVGTATLPNLAQSGGTLTGAGTLTVSGATSWTGGTMAGTGTTNANGGLTLGADGTGDVEVLERATLNNAGAATLASANGGYGLDLSSVRHVWQSGWRSFSIIDDAWILDGGGSPNGGTFINAATLAKTGGTTSVIGITLDNTGAINVQSESSASRGVAAWAGRSGCQVPSVWTGATSTSKTAWLSPEPARWD